MAEGNRIFFILNSPESREGKGEAIPVTSRGGP
jgi:hypothetical protein